MFFDNSISGSYSIVKFLTYAACSRDFSTIGSVLINASTNSSVFSSDISVLSASMVRNISSSIWNACIHVISVISFVNYLSISPMECWSFAFLFSIVRTLMHPSELRGNMTFFIMRAESIIKNVSSWSEPTS